MMKKTCFVLMSALMLAACGGAGSNDAAKSPEQDPDYVAGKDLVAKSDCATCHKVDEQYTGPSFKMIAAKYPYNAESFELLANKIIKGGTGVWGQVPMIPHASLNHDDAVKMVKYILKNK